MMQSSTNVVVLSSSPACVSSHTPSQIERNHEKRFELSPQSSSPSSLVSPSELFKTASTSRFFNADVTARKKKKAPNSMAGKCEKLPLGEMENISEDKPKGRAKKSAKKTEAGPGDGNTAGKTTRKSTRAKGSESTKPNKRGGSNDKILTGKVAKTGNGLGQRLGKQAEVMPPSPASQFGPGTSEGLQLEEAMERRLDWTPPKDTTPARAVELDNETESSPGHIYRHDFGNMLSEYNFIGDMSSSREPNRTAEAGGPTKRRRIELVGNGIFPVSKTDSKKNNACVEDKPSTKRPKKQQKRITTITAHATAKYISNDSEQSATPDRDVSTTGDLAIEGAINRRLQRRTKRDTTDYTVLSPEAAVKSFQDQDLMFGTCSQLERDDSPATLEETQLAIHASESCASTEQNSHSRQSTAPTSSSLSAVSRFASSRNLWSVAARDSEGSMIQAEMVDLVDSPDISKIASAASDFEMRDRCLEIYDQPEPVPRVPSGKECSKSKDNPTLTKNTPVAVDQYLITGSQNEEPHNGEAESHAPPMPRYSGFTDSELSKAIASYGFKSIKSRKKMIDLLQKCWDSKYGKTKNTIDTAKRQDGPPATSSMSQSGSHSVWQRDTAQGNLSTNTSSKDDNEKPQRQKGLDPATNSKTNATSTGRIKQRSIGRTLEASTKNMAPKRKYTGRKNSSPQPPPTKPSTSFQDVEEIDDSEDDAIPSPSRLLQNIYANNNTANNNTQGNNSLSISTIPSSPSPKTPKPNKSLRKQILHPPSTSDLDLPSSRTESLPDLAAQITRAVFAQPRLSLPSNKRLTWHEKILMYDPIVLEDFATWLNIEGLGLVEEDREVSAGFLRGWCEGRGICCCWKKGDGW